MPPYDFTDCNILPVSKICNKIKFEFEKLFLIKIHFNPEANHNGPPDIAQF